MNNKVDVSDTDKYSDLVDNHQDENPIGWVNNRGHISSDTEDELINTTYPRSGNLSDGFDFDPSQVTLSSGEIRPELVISSERETETYQERQQRRKVNEMRRDNRLASQSSLDSFSDWVNSTFSSSKLVRYVERTTDSLYAQKAGWSVQEKDIKELQRLGYSRDELDYIGQSTSPINMKTRLEDVGEDRRRNQILTDLEMPMIGTIALGMVDPLNWVSGAIAGKAAYSMYGANRIKNALITGGVSSAEAAAYVMLDKQVNPNYQPEDFVGSMVASGLLGMGFGYKYSPRPYTEAVVSRGDSVDDAAKDYMDEINHIQAKGAQSSSKNSKGSDQGKIAIDQYAMDLSYIIKKGSRYSERQIKKNINKIKEKRGELKDIFNEDINNHWEMKDNLSGSSYRKAVREAKNITRDYLSKEDYLISSLEKQDSILRKIEDSKSARKELAKWKKLTDEEKVALAIPEDTIESVKKREETTNSAVFEHEYKVNESIKDDVMYSSPKKEKDTFSLLKETKKEDSVKEEKFINDSDYPNKDTTSELVTASAKDNESVYNNLMSKFEKASRGKPNSYYAKSLKWATGDFTILDNSKSKAVRMLNAVFNESPRGNFMGASYAGMVDTYMRRLVRTSNGGFKKGFLQWRREDTGRGIGHRSYSKFQKELVSAIRSGASDESVGEGIAFARRGYNNMMREASTMLKESGSIGWSDVTHSDKYIPDVMLRSDIQNLRIKEGLEDKQIIKLFSEGYYSGDNKITKRQAHIVAKARVTPYLKELTDDLDDIDGRVIFRSSNSTELKSMLRAKGFTESEAKEAVKDMIKTEDWKSISNRARKSLRINHDAEIVIDGKSFRVGDYMSQDLEKMAVDYARGASVDTSLAQLGMKSKGRFLGVMELAKEVIAQEQKGVGYEAAKSIQRDMDRLKKSISIGSQRAQLDYSKSHVRATSRLLDFTTHQRLAKSGTNAIAEYARLLNDFGLQATLRNMKGAEVFRHPFSVFGGRDRVNFEANDPYLREGERIMGFSEADGHTELFRHHDENYGVDDYASTFGQKIDTYLDTLARVNAWTSLNRTIQGSLERITSKSLYGETIRAALGKRKLTRGMSASLKIAGISEDKWKSWSDFAMNNRLTETYNGRKYDLWDVEKMPKDMKEDWIQGMNNMHRSMVQRGLAGDINSDWTGLGGRILTQFKRYSLISAGKQLIAHANADMVNLSTLMSWGTAMAFLSYASSSYLESLGSDDQEKYMEDAMTDGLGWGVLNKHSSLASMGIITDLAYTLGVMPDDMADVTKYGYMKDNPTSLIPLAGMANDMYKFGSSTRNLAQQTLIGDDKDREDAFWNMIRRGRSLAPITNAPIIGSAIKTELE